MSEYYDFTDSEKAFIATIISSIRSGTRTHRTVENAFYLSYDELSTVFGDKYKSKTNSLFQCVDDSYIISGGANKKGTTKAYRWTAEAEQYIDSPEFRISPGKKKPNSREEKVLGLERGRYLVDHFKYDENRTDNFFTNVEDWRTCRLFVDHCDPEAKVNYASFRRVSGKHGRQFASTPSLQSLPRYFREIVIGDMTDIDIKNAHPTIALAFARREKLFVPNLTLYVERRDEVLKSLMTYYGTSRDAVKELMLMATYLSYLEYRTPTGKKKFAYTEWCDDHKITNRTAPPFLKVYQQELKELSKICRKTAEAQQWQISFTKKENRFFSKFVQVVEDQFIQYAEEFFSAKGRALDSIMFDGFMISGEVSDSDLRELEDYLQVEFEKEYGMKMNLKLDKDYYPDPDAKDGHQNPMCPQPGLNNQGGC